jgi:hypothetical protein
MAMRGGFGGQLRRMRADKKEKMKHEDDRVVVEQESGAGYKSNKPEEFWEPRLGFGIASAFW